MMHMNVKFYPALPKEYREPVWNILCESNNDFVPPLSARYNDGGEEEFDLTKVKIDRFPTIYFNKIISLSFLIAFDDETGEVMGFTAFKHGYSSDELHNFSPLNYISTTCVSKKYRNKGVAQRLYQFLEEELPPSFRLPYIARRTWSTNYPQIHLYRIAYLNQVFSLNTLIK